MATSSRTKPQSSTAAETTLAKSLAPEEIQVGDYVTPLHFIAEVPSYYWFCEGWNLPPDQPVRIRLTTASDGIPLRVKSICLPFVLAKRPTGESITLDLRKCHLARLDARYAKNAWKAYKKPQVPQAASS